MPNRQWDSVSFWVKWNWATRKTILEKTLVNNKVEPSRPILVGNSKCSMSMNYSGGMAEISSRNVFSNHADSQDVKKHCFTSSVRFIFLLLKSNDVQNTMSYCWVLSTEAIHTTKQKKPLWISWISSKPIRNSKAILHRLAKNKTKTNV